MTVPSEHAAVQNKLREACFAAGVVQQGHFVLNSGRHSSKFFAKEELGKRPKLAQPIYSEMARLIFRASRELGITIDAIVAPAVSGVSLTEWVAYHADFLGVHALALYAEKDDTPFKLSDRELIHFGGKWQDVPKDATLSFSMGGFDLKRNFADDVKDKNVVIIDNVITTGGSMKRTAVAVVRAGGNVMFGVALCNRGKVTPEGAGVPRLYEAVSVDFTSTTEDECPLCRDGVPVNTNFGHGAKYMGRRLVATHT